MTPRTFATRRRLAIALLPLAALACRDGAASRAPAPIPQRVVSLAPALTETIYAIGAQDLLVGVTPYCKFPPEAQSKVKVGALVDVSYEKLSSLKPDLVVLLPGQAEDAGKLARLGIRTETFRTETVADILAVVEKMGALLGKPDRAASLAAELNTGYEALQAKGRERLSPSGARPRVLFVVGRDPGTLKQIYAVGSGNYLDELLAAIGAANALGQTPVPWPVVGKESILQIDPDVILDGSLYSGEAPSPGDSRMQAWAQLDMLSAVKAGKVVPVRDERLMIPGPGFVECAARLAEAVFGPDAAAMPTQTATIVP